MQENRKLKYLGYSVVFQEVPDEVSLVFNISGCPYRCEGCHSPYLWKYDGFFVSDDIDDVILKYKNLITCVCFMGGDQNEGELIKLMSHIKVRYKLKTCLYSGKDNIDEIKNILSVLDFIKIGSYKKDLGALNSTRTNQRLYKVDSGKISEDITYKFWERKTDSDDSD